MAVLYGDAGRTLNDNMSADGENDEGATPLLDDCIL